MESSEDAIVTKDLDGIITSWNPAAERLYGYTAEEAIGRPISMLIPSSRPAELPSIMERLRRGERIQHVETTRLRKDGSTFEISLSLSPIRDGNGRIVGAAGIGREITDRRKAERERADLLARERSAREQLDAILGGVADGVLVQREDGTYVYANDTAARMAGFDSVEEYLGAAPQAVTRRLSVLDQDGQPFSYDLLPARRAFRGEAAPEMVVQFRRADTDEVRWSHTQARIMRGTDGERLAISIFHDITDQMRARDRLRFLAEAGAQLAGSLNIDETLAALVRVASATLADWAVVILIDDDGTVRHIASAHRDPEKEPLTRELHERQLTHASGAALLWESVQSGEPDPDPCGHGPDAGRDGAQPRSPGAAACARADLAALRAARQRRPGPGGDRAVHGLDRAALRRGGSRHRHRDGPAGLAGAGERPALRRRPSRRSVPATSSSRSPRTSCARP